MKKLLAAAATLFTVACGAPDVAQLPASKGEPRSFSLIAPSAPNYVSTPGACQELTVGKVGACSSVATLKQELLAACPAPREIGAVVFSGLSCDPSAAADTSAETIEFQCCVAGSTGTATSQPGPTPAGAPAPAAACFKEQGPKSACLAVGSSGVDQWKTSAQAVCTAKGMALAGFETFSSGCAPGSVNTYVFGCCPAGATPGTTTGTGGAGGSSGTAGAGGSGGTAGTGGATGAAGAGGSLGTGAGGSGGTTTGATCGTIDASTCQSLGIGGAALCIAADQFKQCAVTYCQKKGFAGVTSVPSTQQCGGGTGTSASGGVASANICCG